jgi:hypothetical protein
MGKMLIIIIVVITAIFATITLTVQNKSSQVADTVTEQLDELRAKDIGAYALNYAIKLHGDGVISNTSIPAPLINDDDPEYYEHALGTYDIMEGSIDNLYYSFVDFTLPKDSLLIKASISHGTISGHKCETIVASTWGAIPSEVGDWSFDEGTGTDTEDGNDNSNDGTLINVDEGTVWDTGQFGTAIHIDGTNDRVELEDGVSSTYDDVMTVTVWALLDASFLDWGTFIAEQTDDGGWNVCWTLRGFILDLWFFQYVKYAFDVVTASTVEEVQISKSSWQMDPYEWHFLVGSYDGTYSETEAEITIQVYDEGFSASKIIDKWSRRDSTNSVFIGGRETNTSWFGAFTCIDATLDEVKMFDSILTPAELADLYNNNATLVNEILYWNDNIPPASE